MGYQLAHFREAWLQVANVAQRTFFTVERRHCYCTEPLTRASTPGSRNVWLESVSLIMAQARANPRPVRGTGDMFAAAHPFHASVCPNCKRTMERKWRDLESSWTAGLARIDLVSVAFCSQVRRNPFG